jgi:hypothetical protein
MMKSYTIGNNNHITWLPIFVLGLLLLFTACPEKNNPPPIADCDPGYHPCETDSTECCLDTTSHNFVWEIDTLGDYGSYLNDVAIVDENNIWVVGYIKDGDSTYNAARWDGNEWELISVPIPIIGPGGVVGHAIFTLQSVLAFNSHSIWFTGGGVKMVKWDGNQFTDHFAPYQSIEGSAVELWGTSESDIFLVGSEGLIVHYDGNGFERMESGTELILRDIEGLDGHVFIVGYDDSGEHSGQSIALELNDDHWTTLFTSDSYSGDLSNGDYGRFQSIEVFQDTVYFTTGATWLLKYNYHTGTTGYIPRHQYFPDGYRLIDVSGNNIHDLLLVSAWGNLFHYNGVDWRRYRAVYDFFGSNNCYPRKGQLKGDVAVVVGLIATELKGIVIRGYRIR